MKLLKEIYGLFVGDPWLALMGLVALALGLVAVKMGAASVAWIPVMIVIIASLAVSVRRG
jgi:hypothetical protein